MTKARDNASGGLGLILIKPSSVVNGTDNGKGTVSFSGQTTVSLNDVFSSTYDNYRIVINLTTTGANADVSIRLRVSGSDASGTDYSFQALEASSTTIVGSRQTGATSGRLGAGGTTYGGIIVSEICNPFSTSPTRILSFNTFVPSTSLDVRTHGFLHTLSTSYTGFTIFPTSSTISGTVSVYGYNK